MRRKYWIGGLLLPVLATVGRADDKPKLPQGSPPRLVSVVAVKGDIVIYRDFLSASITPKTLVRVNPAELLPSADSAGPGINCAVEFSLQEGEVFDAAGNRLDVEDAKSRLVLGATVLVSTSGKKVDPAYLGIVKAETLILVPPPVLPGPGSPGNVALWTQNYDPAGSWPVSTLAAALPVLVLLGLLASGRASAWLAALAGLVTAATMARAVFGMPVELVLASAAVGVVFAVFRIIWLIVAAVFLYDLAVQTGQFDVMKASIARLSGDRRIQAVLVAFSFGAFIEGAAGFGAPVAISAAFLVGLGFRPFQAALLCLIANTAPVAWGAIGTPILTLSSVTGIDVNALSATSGRILPPLSLIIPFWLVATMAGWRATVAVWPALLAVGGTFAGVQFAWSNFVGFELVDIVSAVASLAAGVAVLAVWKPRDEWRFEHDAEGHEDYAAHQKPVGFDGPLTAGRVARAWTPFALLTLTVLLWGLPASKTLGTPAVKTWLDQYTSFNKTEMPGLHLKIFKGEKVTGRATPDPKRDREEALLPIVPISSTGTAVFVAAVLSGFFLGVGPATMARTFVRTWVRMIPAIAAIVSMLALGFVTKYSGMDAVLGLAFTRTGPMLYPVFGTLLGWLGVALTGSDTSSNVLFGNLQKITARKLGLSEVLMASANTTGGVMGKMIDAQSIVVAAAATGEGGREGEILRAVLGHSIALALLVGGIVWLYAHMFPWVVVGR